MNERSGLRERMKAACPELLLAAARAVRKALFPARMRAKRFTGIYETNAWQDDESVSGSGSNLIQTETLRAELPTLLKRHEIRSLLDAPCGDLCWIAHTELPVEDYIGADIVPDIIEMNRQRFQNDGWSFVVADIIRDDLPRADAILCRDCLVHLSFREALAAIRNMKRSGARYLLTTHFTDRDSNTDIQTGDWRPLNLRLAPFDFPEPCDLINERCTELDGKYSDKCLAMWRLADLAP